MTKKLGYLQIIASGICFGFIGILGKWAFAKGLTSGEILWLRFSLSSAILGTALLIKHPRSLLLPPKTIIVTAGLGIFGYALFAKLYFLSLEGLSASLTVLLLYTYPILVSLGGVFFFREQLSKTGLIALALVTLGLACLVWGDLQIRNPVAIIYGLGAALFYSIYILASRHFLRDIEPFAAVFYIQLFAASILGILYFQNIEHTIAIASSSWWIIGILAIVCSIFAMSLFLMGLAKLNGTETSILSTTEPLTGVFVAMFFLGESMSYTQIFGGALVIISMIILNLGAAEAGEAKTST